MNNLIIRCRCSLVALLMIVINGVAASAATPWTLNPADYRYDMSLYLDLSFADGKMDYAQYDVAAFVGDECRGIAEVLPTAEGQSCLYLRARSNSESGEKLTFKYHNKSTDEVLPVEAVSIDFVSNSRLGYPSTPHVVNIVFYHDVAISASEGGSVDNVGGRLAEGTTFDVAAVAAEGYHFVKWDDGNTDNPRSISVAKDDISLKALFEPNIYKLTYTVDGAEYRSANVAYGTALTAEDAPEKVGYTFSGWSEIPATMPAHDVVVMGTFTINSYKAVFKIDGDTIDTKTIAYGEPVEAAVAPEKEGYTFLGWSEIPATMPAHDIEIVGSYKVNIYKLTYTVDGAEYRSADVAYGTALTAEAAPEKVGYTFSGWSEIPATMPAHDVEISGSFSINSYKAVFKIDGDTIDTKTIVYGESVEPAVAPEKEGYTFLGWSEIPATMPAHDIEILGSYKVNIYKLTYTVDGTEYKSADVAYGTTLTAEAAPEKVGYTFSGWSEMPATMPAHDVEVSGSFAINSYKLTVYVDNEVYMDTTIQYGEPVSVAEPTIGEGKIFAGWDIEIPATMPAHDLTIHGTTTLVSALGRIFANDAKLTIYDMNGGLIYKNISPNDATLRLQPGLYIVNGKKLVLR